MQFNVITKRRRIKINQTTELLNVKKVEKNLRKRDTPSNAASCWPWVATRNAWRRTSGGKAMHDLTNEIVSRLTALHFGSYWPRREGWKCHKQSADFLNPRHLYDCPHCILRVALVANKYATLFYLKGARNRWLRVICAEITTLEPI